MDFETIRFSLEDGVARIQLNRPEAMNALSRSLLGEFRAALDIVANSPEARVLLVNGEGKCFSSGADLSSSSSPAGQAGVDAGQVLDDHYNPIMQRLFSLPVPIVSAVHGATVGAGCMLALAADVVIAARSAYFLQAFVNVGLVPDAGSTWWLPRLVGAGRASGMMLLGERIPAETAASWGMIYEMVEDGELETRATAVAAKFALGPTKAYDLTRQAIRMGLQCDFATALQLERRSQKQAGLTEDFAEGVAAFRERRKPEFKGR